MGIIRDSNLAYFGELWYILARIFGPGNRTVLRAFFWERLGSSLTILDNGLKIHMKKFGFVRVFISLTKKGKNGSGLRFSHHGSPGQNQSPGLSAGRLKIIPRVLKELCCVRDCKIRKETEKRPAKEITSTVPYVFSSDLWPLTVSTTSHYLQC